MGWFFLDTGGALQGVRAVRGGAAGADIRGFGLEAVVAHGCGNGSAA